MTTPSIEGLWESRYEYGRGPDDLPQASEDQMQFYDIEGGAIGVSLPNSEGSKVTVWLTQNDTVFSGEWRVQTAPKGHYEGRVFKGLLMLILENDTLEGGWLGPNTVNDRIKSGRWTFKRVRDGMPS